MSEVGEEETDAATDSVARGEVLSTPENEAARELVADTHELAAELRDAGEEAEATSDKELNEVRVGDCVANVVKELELVRDGVPDSLGDVELEFEAAEVRLSTLEALVLDENDGITVELPVTDSVESRVAVSTLVGELTGVLHVLALEEIVSVLVTHMLSEFVTELVNETNDVRLGVEVAEKKLLGEDDAAADFVLEREASAEVVARPEALNIVVTVLVAVRRRDKEEIEVLVRSPVKDLEADGDGVALELLETIAERLPLGEDDMLPESDAQMVGENELETVMKSERDAD
jgi:hypothetical protein